MEGLKPPRHLDFNTKSLAQTWKQWNLLNGWMTRLLELVPSLPDFGKLETLCKTCTEHKPCPRGKQSCPIFKALHLRGRLEE
ncbi:hypothetical protein Y1Q_0016153 [Alligator mississippiensis]|uniref:Uncharacterized protein n=1 Tax=Alligator mississippiensis TaxID=8496 RepID=A0A151P0W7_ALLMI|nr:hypothetical protein Y1Q_0016153 [Alligator mississippiensis]